MCKVRDQLLLPDKQQRRPLQKSVYACLPEPLDTLAKTERTVCDCMHYTSNMCCKTNDMARIVCFDCFFFTKAMGAQLV